MLGAPEGLRIPDGWFLQNYYSSTHADGEPIEVVSIENNTEGRHLVVTAQVARYDGTKSMYAAMSDHIDREIGRLNTY